MPKNVRSLISEGKIESGPLQRIIKFELTVAIWAIVNCCWRREGGYFDTLTGYYQLASEFQPDSTTYPVMYQLEPEYHEAASFSGNRPFNFRKKGTLTLLKARGWVRCVLALTSAMSNVRRAYLVYACGTQGPTKYSPPPRPLHHFLLVLQL